MSMTQYRSLALTKPNELDEQIYLRTSTVQCYLGIRSVTVRH